MLLEFTKMIGAGNDFVLIDNRLKKIQLSPEQITTLCDRHRGVGADGVALLVPCQRGQPIVWFVLFQVFFISPVELWWIGLAFICYEIN